MSGAADKQVFGEPTPLAMIGLAVGCAALTPIAFGVALTPSALRTAAYFCLLFGGGGQFLAGMMAFANKNTAGGTLLTAFSFNWVMNYLVLEGLSRGVVPDHSVLLAVDATFLVVFVAMTYAFAYVSRLLFVFMAVIDVLSVAKVLKGLFPGLPTTQPTALLNLVIALCTVGMGIIALWIAFGLLINPLAGRRVLPFPGPVFKPATPAPAPAPEAAE